MNPLQTVTQKKIKNIKAFGVSQYFDQVNECQNKGKATFLFSENLEQ